MNNSIQFQNVFKKYGDKTIFEDISFSLSKGITFLVGRNGAGKSTLIKLAVGLESPDKGTIKLFGHNIQQKLSIASKRKLGVQLQNDAFLRAVKVKEYLQLYKELFENNEKCKYSSDYIYQLLDIKSLENNYAYALSGGEKKRLSLMLSIIGNKQLVILDEPTAGIDVEIKDKIINVIKYLKDQHVTLLISSHDLEDFFAISDHILMVDRGIIFCGNKQAFAQKYDYRYKVYSETKIPDYKDILVCNYFSERTLYSNNKQKLLKYFSEDQITPTNIKDVYQIALKLGGIPSHE